MAKRRVLLVDDEVAILLTMKAVLEISGYDVDTATSAREGKSKIKLREYQMIITDMRMESDVAGREVIQAARVAPYHPAVALLTSFPADDWEDMGADKMLVKPMQTAILIKQLQKLLETHAAKLQRLANSAAEPIAAVASAKVDGTKKTPTTKRLAGKKLPTKGRVARKKVATKKRKS